MNVGPLGPATLDLAQIAAPVQAKLAVIVAAAGGHHLWLSGSPGTGRVMLAAAVHALLPDLTAKQLRETGRLTALSPGTRTQVAPDSRRPPWQAPHHTASLAAVIGGRAGGRLVPGAMSLAHHGVLFLEQAGELPSGLVHGIAAALHQRQAILTNAGTSVTFPARFQLVMATEPCPAVLHHPDAACTCGPLVQQRYRQRVAALTARCALRIDLNAAAHDSDPYGVVGRTTDELAARVVAARRRARRRWRGPGWSTNADATVDMLTVTSVAAAADLARCHQAGALSTRSMTAVLRVGWILADLAERARPDRDDIHQALLLHGHA